MNKTRRAVTLPTPIDPDDEMDEDDDFAVDTDFEVEIDLSNVKVERVTYREAPPPEALARAADTNYDPFKHVRIREIPTDERPRERLIQWGAESLSLTDLLAILLRTGTTQFSAIGLAQHLLRHFKSARGLANATIEELSEVHGIGPAKAAEIRAAIEFGRRLVAFSDEERPRITSARDVYNLIGPSLQGEKREHFVALLMDAKGGVLRTRRIAIGDLTSAIVTPRELYHDAVRHAAASVVVAHNHPSGDPTPSQEDILTTSRLRMAGELLGIELLDHIVLGDNRWVSFKDSGLL